MSLRSTFAAFAMAGLMAVAAFAADVNGKWTGEMQTPNGSRPVTFNLTADGSTLNGTTTGRQGEIKITNGKIDGDNVSFDVVREMQGNTVTVHYTGTISGDDLNLKVQVADREPRDLALKRSK